MTSHPLSARGFARVAAVTLPVHPARPFENAREIIDTAPELDARGVAVGVALAITAPWITRIFTTDQTVIDYATVAIIVGALFQPIAGYVFLLDGVLIGAGRGRYLAAAGIALLAAFGRRSTLGALLSGAGLDIAFTTTAVVIAQVFVSLPFLIVTLESALRAREQGLDEMASSLGASPSRVFWQITLPTVLPAPGRGAGPPPAR